MTILHILDHSVPVRSGYPHAEPQNRGVPASAGPPPGRAHLAHGFQSSEVMFEL